MISIIHYESPFRFIPDPLFPLIVHLKSMSHILPTNLTRRYVLSLCARGENHDFLLTGLIRDQTKVDNIPVGFHFRVNVFRKGSDIAVNALSGVGLTVEGAVKNALEKFGIQFKS